MGEVAGRSASEPGGSLVTYSEMPTLWSEGEGRWKCGETTKAPHRISRGSRGGMQRQIGSAGRETRGGGGAVPLTGAYKGNRNRTGPQRESEGFVVPFEGAGEQNPARGKGPCFVEATEAWRMRRLRTC